MLKLHIPLVALATTSLFCSSANAQGNHNQGSVPLIAFVKRSNGKGAIFSVQANGKGLRRLTAGGDCRDPAWTPDGKRLIYTSGRGGSNNQQLWTMNVDGGGQRQLTHFRNGSCSSPHTLPGGKRVLFSYETSEGVPEPSSRVSLCVINLNGSGFKVLTTEEVNSPVFESPTSGANGSIFYRDEGQDAGTGSLELFTSRTRRSRTIYGLGKGKSFYSFGHYALSPNGTRIAFQSDGWVANRKDPDWKQAGLIMMNTNGTGAKLVLKGDHDNMNGLCWLSNNVLVYVDGFALRTYDLKLHRRSIVLAGQNIYSPDAQ